MTHFKAASTLFTFLFHLFGFIRACTLHHFDVFPHTYECLLSNRAENLIFIISARSWMGASLSGIIISSLFRNIFLFAKCVVSKWLRLLCICSKAERVNGEKSYLMFFSRFLSWHNPAVACFWLTFYDVQISRKGIVAFLFRVCSEHIWLNSFGSTSMWWCSATLFQSLESLLYLFTGIQNAPHLLAVLIFRGREGPSFPFKNGDGNSAKIQISIPYNLMNKAHTNHVLIQDSSSMRKAGIWRDQWQSWDIDIFRHSIGHMRRFINFLFWMCPLFSTSKRFLSGQWLWFLCSFDNNIFLFDFDWN